MIDAIVFTKNRPMQLHCLLESLRENFEGLATIRILCRCENKAYFDSYMTLRMEAFIYIEEVFIEDLRSLIERGNGYVALFVDDDIMFKPVSANKIDKAMRDGADIVSLRLGGNIRNKNHFQVKGSLDGNVYRKDQLLAALPEKCQNPNKLEIALCRAFIDKKMAWFSEPSVIGIPANRVSETSGCDFRGQSVEELQELYEQGYRIDWRKMNLECNNVHKYEPYAFRMEQD